MAAELEEHTFHAEIVTASIPDGFTLVAVLVGERANSLRPLSCSDWYEGFQLQTPETHFARWGAIRYVSACIAIGDRLLQSFNSYQNQTALWPPG
jgi:hypothetical protein